MIPLINKWLHIENELNFLQIIWQCVQGSTQGVRTGAGYQASAGGYRPAGDH